MKRLKRGIRIKIFPTFKCSLKCDYCGNNLGRDLHPSENNLKTILDLLGWINLIDNFPVKIREVVISGGEPTIWPDFPELVNYLLSQGYFVTVYTNLTNKNLLNVDKSRRLRVYATFHGRHYDKNQFLKNYDVVSSVHRVDVNEIAQQQLPFSKVDPWGCDYEQSKTINKNYFWIAPDGSIHPHCNGVMVHCRTT